MPRFRRRGGRSFGRRRTYRSGRGRRSFSRRRRSSTRPMRIGWRM